MRLIPLFAALMLSVPAAAQEASQPEILSPDQTRLTAATIVVEPVAMLIATFDADNDARVTRAEFDAGVARSFASADPAGKGAIGYIDFGDWSKRWLGSENALPSPFETDRNGDNSITAAEFAQRFDLYFTQFDKDKDGVILRSELLSERMPVFDRDRRGGGRRMRERQQ